jgi:multidrug efflux pump subunit AcrB
VNNILETVKLYAHVVLALVAVGGAASVWAYDFIDQRFISNEDLNLYEIRELKREQRTIQKKIDRNVAEAWEKDLYHEISDEIEAIQLRVK